jgi:hypothetical protein
VRRESTRALHELEPEHEHNHKHEFEFELDCAHARRDATRDACMF